MKQDIKKLFVGASLGLLVSQSFAFSQKNPISQNQQQNQVEEKQKINTKYIIRNEDFEKNLPKQASEWLSYVKNNNQEIDCPQSKDGFECSYLSSAILEELNGEIQITLKGSVFANGYILLPEAYSTKDKIWFRKILINNKDAELSSSSGKDMISVSKGDFELKLTINRSKSSELDHIDFNNAPLVFLNKIQAKEFYKTGNQIRFVTQNTQKIDDNKIKVDTKTTVQEDFQVNVYRKIATDIPNYLSTKIKITYSGKAKDFFLGKVLPESFQFIDARSSLKIEKKDDGFWLKLLPGENTITINAFTLKNIDKINTKNLISETINEIWSLEQNQQIRQVELSGAQAVDPKQSQVPHEWEMLPAYFVNEGINIVTNRRGIETEKKLEINLAICNLRLENHL